MDTLWLKFPDDVLSGRLFTSNAKKNLEDIFSNATEDSPWRKSLSLLGMPPQDLDEGMIYWHGNLLYFNWTQYIQIISGGSVTLKKTEGAGHALCFHYSFKSILSLMRVQWRITKFLKNPPEFADAIIESITLGLILQALILRLGAEGDRMEEWLAFRERVPKRHVQTIAQIQVIQVRRTQITDVWCEYLDFSEMQDDAEGDYPESFWSDDIPEIKKQNAEQYPNGECSLWRGKTVCAGNVVGVGIAIDLKYRHEQLLDFKQRSDKPLILVFKNARPETTELFEYAAGIVFCNGGVLSHACTVAREMNIPCITAVGTGFFAEIKEVSNTQWLQIDATEAHVKKLDTKH